MCLVCLLQNNSEVAIAKLQGTSGFLTHPPGHCGLELLPLSPDSSRQRLLQGDVNRPLAAESLAGETSYHCILAQQCGRSWLCGGQDPLSRPARDYCYWAFSLCWSSSLCCCVDGLCSLSKSPSAALTLKGRTRCRFQEWMEGTKLPSFPLPKWKREEVGMASLPRPQWMKNLILLLLCSLSTLASKSFISSCDFQGVGDRSLSATPGFCYCVCGSNPSEFCRTRGVSGAIHLRVC